METKISHLPDKIIVDEETELRAVMPEYFQEFKTVVENDREHIGKWMPWARGDLDVDSRPFFENAPLKRNADEEFTYSIFVDSHLIGAVGIHKREETKTILEIGYWLSSSSTGKGVMTRSVKALIDTLFGLTTAPAVEIGCDKYNIKSAAIPKRLYMELTREVEIIDDKHPSGYGLYFSVARQEWEDRKY